jgi:D-xylose 1-dehydrogenase (NADP+, D-xylono-1,5-lactone-forming)
MRLGLLSTARINHATLTAAALTDAVDVVAVASRDAVRADAYARENAIPRSHGSYDALLADDGVDAIYVSLPNGPHVEWTVRALEAGKHVLCEKPMGRRPEAVERAFALAETQGLVVMEAFMYRHHPQTRALRQCVASGRIGELRQIRTSYASMLEDPDDVRLRPELDGGALMDLGCYCLSGARLLGGEPVTVFGRQRLASTAVDIGFTGVLEFPDDVFAEFHCGFDLPYESGLEAIGSEGRVVVREPFTCSDPHLELNGERIDVDDADRYRLQLENFAAAAAGRAEPLLDREDAVMQARTIDALYRSAVTGEGVSL